MNDNLLNKTRLRVNYDRRLSFEDWIEHVQPSWIGMHEEKWGSRGPVGYLSTPTVEFDEDAVEAECLAQPDYADAKIHGVGRTKANVRKIRGIAIELEGFDDHHYAVEDISDEDNWPPTAVIETGLGGYELLWLFEQPLDLDVHNEEAVRDAEHGLIVRWMAKRGRSVPSLFWGAGGHPKFVDGTTRGTQDIVLLGPRISDFDAFLADVELRESPARLPLTVKKTKRENNEYRTQARANKKGDTRKCHGVIVEVFGSFSGPRLCWDDEHYDDLPTERSCCGLQEHHLFFLWETARELNVEAEEDCIDEAYRLIRWCQARAIAVEMVHWTNSGLYQWRRGGDLAKAWEFFVDRLGEGAIKSHDYIIRAQCWAGTLSPRLNDNDDDDYYYCYGYDYGY